jgi:peptidoglycan hydrolase-like protein with peptidoglycan-binding domain
VAAFEREARRRRPLAAARRSVRWPQWMFIAAAFLLGVVMTTAIALVVLRGPRAEPEVLIVEPAVVVAPFGPAPRLQPAAVVSAPNEPGEAVASFSPPVAPTPSGSQAELIAGVEPPAVELAAPSSPAVAELAVQAPASEPAPTITGAAVANPGALRVARIREIQALLIAQGHDLGRADGDAGPQTLAAASEFAATHGLLDSNLDDAFLAALRAADAGRLVPVAPLAQRDPVLEQINRVRSTQTALNELGHGLGRPDGDAGPMTLVAVEQFAASRGLADANIDDALVALLHEAVDAR